MPTTLFCASSIIIFSVPALISEAAVRTRTPPGISAGGGTFSRFSSPDFTCWRTCFMGGKALST